MKKTTFLGFIALCFNLSGFSQLFSSGNNLITGNKVGIGINAPLSTLHVNGGQSAILLGNTWQIRNEPTFRINNSCYYSVMQSPAGFVPANIMEVFGNVTYGTNTPVNYMRFVINNNGYVGIGLDVASYKLDVNGDFRTSGIAIIGSTTMPTPSGYNLYVKQGILTEKLKIANVNSTEWSDYVFDKDYKLMELNEVSMYVKHHKHLPNVPSAKEVSENGIDVVKMEATLLRKIEELTLYLIELQNENVEIKRELNILTSNSKN